MASAVSAEGSHTTMQYGAKFTNVREDNTRHVGAEGAGGLGAAALDSLSYLK